VQQLNELKSIAGECDRVVKGMLDGSVTRDDGLFAVAATLQKTVAELISFVSYALPLIHTIDQAMRAAQAQAAQAAAQAQAEQVRAQAEQMPQMPQVPPQALPPPQAEADQAHAAPLLSAVPSSDIQVVAGTPKVRP